MERSISLSDPSVLQHERIVPKEYKRSKTLTSVDWKLLLAYNPPPGYRPRDGSGYPSITGCDVIADGEDKVLAILRNILRYLEYEIREDKKRLKEEKRINREDRRRRRQETTANDMSQYGNRRTFRTASPQPFFPTSTDLQRQNNNRRSQDLSTDEDLSLVTVGSLSRIEEVPGVKRAGSSLGSDWSRHSHDPPEDIEPTTSLRSEADSASTTETLTDHDISAEVSDTSFSSRSRSTTPVSGISRAKTSYVNDDVVNRHIRGNYVRSMDARKKRLVFRKQMNKLDVLPNLSGARIYGDRNQHSIEENTGEQDVPFSIKNIIDTQTDEHTVPSLETNSTHLHLNHSKSTDRVESISENTRAVRKQLYKGYSTPENVTKSINDRTEMSGESRSDEKNINQNARAVTKQLNKVGRESKSNAVTKSVSDTTCTHPTEGLQLSTNTDGTPSIGANYNNIKKPTPPKKPIRNKLRNTASESSLEGSPTVVMSQSDLWRSRTDGPTTPERSSRPVFTIGPRGRSTRHDDRPRPDTERSPSGTSGYSTDEYSYKTSDSDEEETNYNDVNVHNYRDQLNKYFMVLRNGEKMAVMLDEMQVPGQEAITRKSLSLSHSLSMSDLAIPDHVGWIIHQSEQRKMWGVVVDMLFCIFEGQENDKPEEVILLPGCNIRPLVYKTAINGLHTRKPAKTITGIAKYQIVIDNASTRKKHLFGLESAAELDTWFSVLKRASTLDPESTNELVSSAQRDSITSTDDTGSGDLGLSRTGYNPTRNSMNRAQKLSSSPLSSPRSESPTPSRSGDRCASPSFYKQNGNQSSPRGQPVVRHDSKRHSIQDIKKHLRREPEQEVAKNQPVKAHHFVPQVAEPVKPVPEKKLRSFGSFESLLKFKKKRKKKHSLSEDSNDDTASVISSSSIEQEMTSQSMDISATSSKLKKSKRLSKSLELNDQRKESNGLVRRASDIKDKVFPKRAQKQKATLGDLTDVTIHGFLYHKYHLKWHKLWCVVCRGCFYGFKSQSPSEHAHVSAVLANCAVVYVMRKDKREKHLYVFKLSQENKKSIYLCSSDYRELQQWLTVLQMESNSVIVNADELRPFRDSESESVGSSMSSPNGSVLNMQTNANQNSNANLEDEAQNSRSRAKKKKQAPPKPPRHSSCPPSVSRDPVSIQTGSESSATDDNGRTGSISSQSENTSMFGSQDNIPQHDRAVEHVWQNERGYLFNVIRKKLTEYRARKSSGDIYNRETNGFNNEGLLVIQDASKRKGSRHVRRSRSFSSQPEMSELEQRSTGSPLDSPSGHLRQRHKPLVVKKIPAKDLEPNQTAAGYMEKKSMSAEWMRYWFVLHEGTLFCYLNTDDHLTVDVLNLHGYTVTSLVDQFRGKRFVLELSHEHFTSAHLSLDSRDEMDEWYEFLQHATEMPSSGHKEHAEEDEEQGACAGCEENRNGDVGERRKQVKQKLLEEMLRQKHELEKKQAERHKKQRSRGKESPDKSSNTGDFMTEDQRTSDVTRLRQRRLSTQLKVDTIQKQMDKPTHNRKGIFGFGKPKKVDENKNMFLQDQLKELNTKLNKIDTDLSHVELQDNVFESFDVNQNSKHMSLNTSGELKLERINEQDGVVNNKRPSSVKTTMNKWTNKTFTSTKKKQNSTDKLILNGSVSNSSLKQNGGGYDVIDGNSNGLPEFGNDSDSNSEDVLSNSFTDLTRPTADLRLDLNPSYSSVPSGMDASPTSTKYTRSNSRSSTVSSLSSPRREINPSVLAEIDAFEELTRQVLGARSKEQVGAK